MKLQCASRSSAAARGTALLLLLTLSGCQIFRVEKPAPPPPPPPPPPSVESPLATHVFTYEPGVTTVVGEVQITKSHQQDTFADIARRFDLGYDELVRANPGVDPWLPGEGTRIVLPTRFVIPDGPREGILINVAAMRLFYFPKAAKGESRVVVTYPIGIGKIGWATPTGTTKVVSKRKDPVWTPPASVRKEHRENGDPLPARVPAGPDNPLGAYAMNLGWTSYLIHGTNKPPGVGMRASHGCIRLYPEDIASLFGEVSVGTKVTAVNQPLLVAWQGESLFLQAYPQPVEGKDDTVKPLPLAFDGKVVKALGAAATAHGATVNTALAELAVTQSRGIVVPVSERGLTMDAYLDAAREVHNAVPDGSNWDGIDGPPASGADAPASTAAVPAGR